MKKYRVVYQTPPDEFDLGGESISPPIEATCSKQALIKANVWYYGETKPTCNPPHPVEVVEVV